MIHPNEPKLKELKEIAKALYKAPATEENFFKIKAIESQIKRHETNVALSE